MLILKVSLERSVTAVSHKETNRRDYWDLQGFEIENVAIFLHLKIISLFLLLNDSLFKQRKKTQAFFSKLLHDIFFLLFVKFI